jgi:hypothetical protein
VTVSGSTVYVDYYDQVRLSATGGSFSETVSSSSGNYTTTSHLPTGVISVTTNTTAPATVSFLRRRRAKSNGKGPTPVRGSSAERTSPTGRWGLTIVNTNPGATCYTAATKTYSANCFDTLNIITDRSQHAGGASAGESIRMPGHHQHQRLYSRGLGPDTGANRSPVPRRPSLSSKFMLAARQTSSAHGSPTSGSFAMPPASTAR